MTTGDVVAILGSISGLIVSITGLVAILRSNARQNAKAEERAAKLDEVHKAIVPANDEDIREETRDVPK